MEETLNQTQHVDVPEYANIHALRRRSRGRQPPSFFQLLPQQVRDRYYCFTLKLVENGLIIHDPKKRVLVPLFPQATIPSHLLSTLETSFQDYECKVSFPKYDYTHKRGDYEIRILGCWFKSGPFLQPYMTGDYHRPH